MLPIILYCLLNLIGFLFFYAIWTFIDKPEPYDYTTIPGLKTDDIGVTKAEIQLPANFTKPITSRSKSKGNCDKIATYAAPSDFLHYLCETFGPLSVFFWGPRYVVNVGDLRTFNELEKYKKFLIPINVAAYASVLLNDSLAHDPSHILHTDLHYQRRLFMDYDGMCNSNLKYVADSAAFDWKNQIVVLMFSVEIEIRAHPIPERIPLLCDMKSLLKDGPGEAADWLRDSFSL